MQGTDHQKTILVLQFLIYVIQILRQNVIFL